MQLKHKEWEKDLELEGQACRPDLGSCASSKHNLVAKNLTHIEECASLCEMSDFGKSCVPICRIEATTYAKDLNSNSNSLPATAQHIVTAGQTSAGLGQVNEVASTAASLF